MDSVFNWVKAHVGIQGNENADRLAKKAAMDDKEEIVYGKIPRETIITEEIENRITRWQKQRTSSTKGAVSKLLFPYIKENKDHVTYLSRIYGYGNGSQFNQIIPPQIQDYSHFNMPLQTKRRTDN
jgi:hypothetical protein